MSVTLDTIHDLETQIDELKTRAISLQASLDAQSAELQREQDANEALARECNYWRAYAVRLGTRVHLFQEGLAALQRDCELGGYAPQAVATFRDASAEQVDAALERLGKTFGANGGEAKTVQEGGAPPLDKLS